MAHTVPDFEPRELYGRSDGAVAISILWTSDYDSDRRVALGNATAIASV